MITSIRLKNFKNFADETLRVGPFTILVGANASGKSNIRDAFRFLSGIGRGYTLAEIFGGKREAGWNPIRGAMNEIVRFGQEAFAIEVGLKLDGAKWHYSIEVGSSMNTLHVTKEKLKIGLKTVYSALRDDTDRLQVTGDNLPFPPEYPVKKLTFQFGLERPFLSVLSQRSVEPDTEFDLGPGLPKIFQVRDMEKALQEFAQMRFPEFSPERMREPAAPGATRLGDNGENLPVVLQKICADPKRKEIMAGWIAGLTPMDVDGFEFPRDPSGRVHLVICEKNGRKVSAYSASDGTLRFLATLTVLLGDNPNGLYFFEEIDTGIHPARQWLLLELIEKQAAKRGIQVITTSHSPDFLTFINDSTFEYLSVVGRLEDSQDAIIRPVAELPNAKELRTSQGLGRLLTGAWMEDMLDFTENHDEAEADGE